MNLFCVVFVSDQNNFQIINKLSNLNIKLTQSQINFKTSVRILTHLGISPSISPRQAYVLSFLGYRIGPFIYQNPNIYVFVSLFAKTNIRRTPLYIKIQYIHIHTPCYLQYHRPPPG